jgi:hypothetical protein
MRGKEPTMRMAIMCALLCLCSATSSADVLLVDCGGGGEYLTIQEAIDAADSGDTLLIAPCEYPENLVVGGKCLTLQGFGPDVTTIVCTGPDEALRFEPTSSPWTVELSGLQIEYTAAGGDSISVSWPYGHVIVRECDIRGEMHGDPNPGQPYGHTSIEVYDSEVGAINVGGDGVSRVERSDVCSAVFWGYLDAGMWYLLPVLHSSDSKYGRLTLVGAECYLTRDITRALRLHGWTAGADLWLELYATDSELGDVDGLGDSCVRIEGCELDSLNYYYEYGLSGYGDFPLWLHDSVVLGDVRLRANRYCGSPSPLGNMHVIHNTILGDLTYDGDGCDPCLHHIRSNIIVGTAAISSGECMVVTHNAVAGGLFVPSAGDSVFANYEGDPLFCAAAAGDYSLEQCSPCVGGAHDGGDIGAFPAGCGCEASVHEFSERVSWGRIKSLYR